MEPNELATGARIIATGGPGAGKTSLLTALASRGYESVPETARAVIKERMLRGLPPRPSPEEFARAILRVDVDQYERTRGMERLLFFDRGIPDALGMLHQAGTLTIEEAISYRSKYPYFPRVLVLPPWEAIYETDAERDQTFAESVRIFHSICEWYRKLGYDLLAVPHGTMEERCEFVLRSLELPPGFANTSA